ncbi:MAG: winged helix-turn-helix domain-containing protein, partial [Thermoanaerobaculia bacterium]|nr:winged helix-turn-helix domain-containing protein [Thermoanaerobaculia bacterium]
MENASHETLDRLEVRGPLPSRTVHLGRVRVDLETWEISQRGHRSRLQEKPFRVLAALLERPGELVTRSELREHLWPDGTIVDFDNNLNSAVARLRTALGDTAKAPRVIETLPRLGYRLIADVRVDDPSLDVGRSRQTVPRWLAAATALVLVALLAVVRQPSDATANRSPDSVGLRPSSSGAAGPDDPGAQRAWQSGLYLLARSAGDLNLALESFEETLRRERDFAPAHVKVAETVIRMSFAGHLELRDGFARAREAAQRARAFDRASAASYRIQALADLHLDWDFESASEAIESALRLEPADAQNYLAAATVLSAAGANDAAVSAVRRAVEIDPASSLLRADLGYFLVAAGRFT